MLVAVRVGITKSGAIAIYSINDATGKLDVITEVQRSLTELPFDKAGGFRTAR
jgi:hypothetical protein